MRSEKIAWSGIVTSVQPRIRLTRSFDQRSHTYLGFILRVRGVIGQQEREFLVGVGQGAHAKHLFRIGDRVQGMGLPVRDPRLETVELYRISKLKLHERGEDTSDKPPPWHSIAPAIPVYRSRGHRRLDTGTYNKMCTSCIWGCGMAVEMIIDQWNPTKRRYRTETFCYGPLSCAHYRAGPTRKVPGRRGMVYKEEDWIDEQEVAHRNPDD